MTKEDSIKEILNNWHDMISELINDSEVNLEDDISKGDLLILAAILSLKVTAD